MKKANASFLKKELARCIKNIRTNWRGHIKLKYLVELYAYAPVQEWHPVQPTGNEVMHAVREGRPDLSMWWNAEKRQIETNKMGIILWWNYCHDHDIPS
ncbi:MAG: hypothetical protein K6F62_01595 [Schwartzia sp.]|nr:hypothetical protein [Schwartzia sp. (in: firmicutes)]